MHVQAVYFSLNLVSEDKHNFDLIIECNGERFSADWKPQSNIVTSIKFSDNESYENYFLEGQDYRIVSIKVSKN
ncbi:hypothetical protein CAR_c11030 [Carnobacterium sp. 17-4]|nr:hypothetical protein CAR_c11030 [Carnobacterium sp. 17-4]